jgi:hypothetical protein
LRFAKNTIEIGEPLAEFQGVMTGVPTYTGSPELLLTNAAE